MYKLPFYYAGKRLVVQIRLKKKLFILNFLLPFHSSQPDEACTNEIKQNSHLE